MTYLEKQNAELRQQVQELQAHIERLRDAFPLFDDDGLCEREHHCEFTLLHERKRMHKILSETPAQALAALKAEWQAEAIRDNYISDNQRDYCTKCTQGGGHNEDE